MNLPEETNHTRLRTNIYREALRTLWDLQAVMPIECSPEYAGWWEQWDAQRKATNQVQGELEATIGKLKVMLIMLEERDNYIWETQS